MLVLELVLVLVLVWVHRWRHCHLLVFLLHSAWLARCLQLSPEAHLRMQRMMPASGYSLT